MIQAAITMRGDRWLLLDLWIEPCSKPESIAWYRTPPPRSLGEEWYQRELEPLLLSHAIPVENRLATYCEHVAMRVVASMKSLLETADSAQSEPTLLVSGGGAHHHYLVTRLEHHLALRSLPLKLVVEPALTDFKEALLFAFLGLQVLLGRPNVWCSVTVPAWITWVEVFTYRLKEAGVWNAVLMVVMHDLS